MGKKELVALLSLSSWCLVIIVWLFLAVPWVCLQFVIVVFPDYIHLLLVIHFTEERISGSPGFTCWISFALVLSLIYC